MANVPDGTEEELVHGGEESFLGNEGFDEKNGQRPNMEFVSATEQPGGVDRKHSKDRGKHSNGCDELVADDGPFAQPQEPHIHKDERDGQTDDSNECRDEQERALCEAERCIASLQVNLASAQTALASTKRELDQRESELEQAKKAEDKAVRELERERQKLENAKADLAKAQEDLVDARSKAREQMARFEDVDRELRDVRHSLENDAEFREVEARRHAMAYLGQLLHERDEERQSYVCELDESLIAIASNAKSIRDDMTDRSNAINRAFRECAQESERALRAEVEQTHASILELAERMQEQTQHSVQVFEQQRDALYKELRTWQEQLYRGEYAELCYCYRDLFLQAERLTSLVGTWRINGMNDVQTDEIDRIRAMVTGLRDRLERAFAAIGLHVFYPTRGERFDPYREILSDYEDGGTGDVVARCVTPGVEKLGGPGEASIVILEAGVELMEASDVN